MMSKPVLFTYFRSSCSWRVRAALALKGIEYENHFINLLKDGGQNLTDEYKKINPLGQVPALKIDGVTLVSSIAIMEYLDEKYPDPPLLPKDPISKAKVRAIVDSIAAGIQPIQNVNILKYVGVDKMADWASHWINHGFKGLEKMLEETSGKYCFGDSITVADLCLAPQVLNSARYKIDLTPFPLIAAINERLLNLDEFQVTHPFRQPDCPDDLKIV